MDPNVSEIHEHTLRSVWPHEEHDFTKWLKNHIDLLGAELGIEIEDARTEESVGDFSSDIVAREMNSGEVIVIENQYNKTDHDHLGKLLTYSSGKNAGFTIWLAEEFRPEHRSVLEWLNESGPTDVKFFGVKPRVVSIDGSDDRGFEFKTIVEPNEWERELADPLTETEQSYRDFFGELIEAYANDRPSWNPLTPGPRNYLTFSAGIGGVSFGWVFHQGPEFAVELYISTSDGSRNEDIFNELKMNQTEIEAQLGDELTWEPLPEKQACRIKQPKQIESRITDLTDEQRSHLISWGVDTMAEFQDEFEPRISDLGSI